MPAFLPHRRAFVSFLALACCLGSAQAKDNTAAAYPHKPITMVVPFSAGGGVDSTARMLHNKLGQVLGQSVVIENLPGAAGTIGSYKVARSAADGYTLLFAVASPLNVAPLVAPSAVRYDTFKDFTPIATVGVSPFVLIGRPGLPAKDVASLIQLVQSQPGKLNFGTDGVGTSLHITAEMIKQRAQLDMVHVPYKSGPQVLTDVAGSQLDLAVLPLTLAAPFIAQGKVQAYGVTSKNRADLAPEVPALAESPVFKDFEVDSWLGVLAPANLPAAIHAKLVQAIETSVKDPEIVGKLADIAVRPTVISGDSFGSYLRKERQLTQDVVTAANIKAE